MRTKPLLLSIFAPTIVLPFCTGCFLNTPPEPAPAWEPVPEPTGIVFNPEEGYSRGVALNKVGDTVLPDAFRAEVVSPTQLILQSVKTVGAKKVMGAPDTSNPVHLAGILTPGPGQTGFEEAQRTVLAWTQGQDLDVDIDSQFPTDRNKVRQVQVFFKGRPTTGKGKESPYAGKLFSLNRMLVRSGYAIVDLNSPTSFDQKQWLYDESYARVAHLGLWQTDVFRSVQKRLTDAEVRRRTPKPAAAPGAPAAAAPALGAPGAPGAAASAMVPGGPGGLPAPGAAGGPPAPGAPGGPPAP